MMMVITKISNKPRSNACKWIINRISAEVGAVRSAKNLNFLI